MEKQIIWRGLLAGALAGVLSFIFSRIFLEPLIDRAIGYEDGISSAREAMSSAAAGHDHGGGGGFEGFTRAVQMNIGMGLGVLLFSVAIGAIFAVVFAVAYGRVGQVSARLLSLLRRGRNVVEPLHRSRAEVSAQSARAQPRRDDPAAHAAVPVDGGAVRGACSLGAVYLGRRLADKLGGWNATLAAVAAYFVASAIVMLALPTIDETPGPLLDDAGTIVYEGFPADVLYDFRLFSLGNQIVIYATIGLAFGVMAAKLLGESNRQESISA